MATAGTATDQLVRGGLRITAWAMATALWICAILLVALLAVAEIALALFGRGRLSRRVLLSGGSLITLAGVGFMIKHFPTPGKVGLRSNRLADPKGFGSRGREAAPDEPDEERERLLALGDAIRAAMRSGADGESVNLKPDVAEMVDEIVRRRRQEEPLEQIRKELGLSRATVLSVVEAYRL